MPSKSQTGSGRSTSIHPPARHLIAQCVGGGGADGGDHIAPVHHRGLGAEEQAAMSHGVKWTRSTTVSCCCPGTACKCNAQGSVKGSSTTHYTHRIRRHIREQCWCDSPHTRRTTAPAPASCRRGRPPPRSARLQTGRLLPCRGHAWGAHRTGCAGCWLVMHPGRSIVMQRGRGGATRRRAASPAPTAAQRPAAPQHHGQQRGCARSQAVPDGGAGLGGQCCEAAAPHPAHMAVPNCTNAQPCSSQGHRPIPTAGCLPAHPTMTRR